MHRTRRPSFVALVLAVLVTAGAVACGSSPSEQTSAPEGGGSVPAPLPTAPVGTTVVPGTAVGTSVPATEVASGPSTTAPPPVGGGALPTAPSTTAAPPVTAAPVAPPTTPAPKVLTPELVRWCPVAGEALRILLNGKSLTAADYDNALQLFTKVRDLAPAEIKPSMEKLITMANTLLAGMKAGEVTGNLAADPGPAKAYIDAKMGPGTYDAGVVALQEVYQFGLRSC